jgi:hypothetical protein
MHENQKELAGSRFKAAKRNQTQLFLSYSRKDQEFVEKLDKALEGEGFLVSRDVSDILPTEEWQSRLGNLIGQSDTVVFALSESSVSSDVCRWEAAYAHKLKKRIAPIVIGKFSSESVPWEIARLNYIFFTDEADFQGSMRSLVTALQMNIEWIREHTWLGERARRWDTQGRHTSGLLLGRELIAAQRWMTAQPNDSPHPDELLTIYIAQSHKAAKLRLRLMWAIGISALGAACLIPAYFYPNESYLTLMKWPALYRVVQAEGSGIKLSPEVEEKAEHSIKQLSEELGRQFAEQRKVQDSSFTPWTVAQYSTALGLWEGSDAPFLESYFRSRVDDSCGCWRETPEKPPHIVATCWVLYSLAESKIPSPAAPLKFLLDMQAGTGWWSIYPSSADQQNASTCATAWAVIVLSAHKELVSDKALCNKLDAAVSAGAVWLRETRIKGRARWYDYPFGARKSDGISVSGLALHALHCALANQEVSDIDQLWLDNLPSKVTSASEFELTDAYIILRDGALDFDRTRNYKMQWALIATCDAFSNGTALQKASALTWFDLVLMQPFITDEALKRSWIGAELVLSLKRLHHLSNIDASAVPLPSHAVR